MDDREKVIKGLELCKQDAKLCFSETECPYQCEFPRCCLKLMADALELLKEHEARVMALDELTEIYVEFKGDNCPIRLTNFDLQKIVKYAVDGDCRLWAGKPTDEQRQAVKWE